MNIDLRFYIRDVPDFPKIGVMFKDITPLLQNPDAFATAVDKLAEPYRANPPDLLAAVEARGFIFAGAVAHKLGCGFVPLRKPGKLPSGTIQEAYELEYGNAVIEAHQDAIPKDSQVLILDDLLAIGGTATAAVNLVERTGGQVVGMAFLIELDFLGGRKRLEGRPIHSVIHYAE